VYGRLVNNNTVAIRFELDSTAFRINVNGTHVLTANVVYAAPDSFGQASFNIPSPIYSLADGFNTSGLDS